MLLKQAVVYTVLLIIVLAIGLGVLWSRSDDNALNRAFDSAQIASGKKLYQQHCASCHGKNLEGQADWKTRNKDGRLPAPPHDETGHTWHHGDQLLFELTKFGMVPPNIPEGYESDMPAFNNVLSDDEIRTVLQFIKSRWPDEIQETQRKISDKE